ncbi:Protein of unknown function (DUF1350) [Seminavis robusta]|uniref:Uncharacterized protein n=1 Tax=Seminavis robusta TaxID=568900 RepID=A0A9N8DYM3_9STRA|nr:Protein of unknown function (DUF1350) [Seminavis robusta]|eukprot:Sro470_g149400.1 Protein of unknown function (DUF1350) (436) ;mRNA; r:2554-4419
MSSTPSFILMVTALMLNQVASGFQPTCSRWMPNHPRIHPLSMVATTEVVASGGSSSALGRWEEVEGNFVLRPSVEDGPPRALVHFLGGALVGAAPHVTYRYLLERLAEQGYLIVATPHDLSFDHLQTCDTIIARFERIAPTLARTYGALPVVGIGHSLGSLLHLLITSLFPDTPRAANALLSFNNKPVQEAVPLFEEFFAPLCTVMAQKNGTVPSGAEAITLGLRLAKTATEGKLPSDELVGEVLSFLQPRGPFMKNSETELPKITIPAEARQAFEAISGPSTSTLRNAGVLPLMTNSVVILEQIPLLIEEVANGARDFVPPPDSVREAVRKAYRARRTLILEYTDDSLDESDEIEDLLKEAERVIRMKRPMVNIDLQRRTLEGNHATPLLAPPMDLAVRAEDVLGAETAKDRLFYDQADRTVEELVAWLEEGNL